MSMRKVYRKVAKKYGISVAEVKKEIQASISEAYMNTPDDGITGAYQNRVPYKGDIPTPDEFIRYCSNQLKAKH